MKKPKTSVGDWYTVDVTSEKGITCFTVAGLDQWDVQEAYEEMMDVLIEMRSVWYNECWEHAYGTSSGNEKEADKFADNDSLIKMMDKALKKAGCQ